jgi:hypothetical protein
MSIVLDRFQPKLECIKKLMYKRQYKISWGLMLLPFFLLIRSDGQTDFLTGAMH